MNSQRQKGFSANRATHGAAARFEHSMGPVQQEEPRFYAEMVTSYMAIYAEYADQVIRHAQSYFKRGGARGS